MTTQLNIDHEDLDDAVYEIADRADRAMDETDQTPYFGHVQTVADLIGFLNHQPQKNAA